MIAFLRAVALTPADHPDLSGHLSDLGLSLRTRFERIGNDADLDAAIDAGRRAVNLTPPGNPNLAPYLSRLGVPCLSGLSSPGTRGPGRRNRCLAAGGEATPPGNPNLARVPVEPGGLPDHPVRALRGQRGPGRRDDAGRRAAELTPPGHPNLPTNLSNLGAPCSPVRQAGETQTWTPRSTPGGEQQNSPRSGTRTSLGTCRTWGFLACPVRTGRG